MEFTQLFLAAVPHLMLNALPSFSNEDEGVVEEGVRVPSRGRAAVQEGVVTHVRAPALLQLVFHACGCRWTVYFKVFRAAKTQLEMRVRTAAVAGIAQVLLVYLHLVHHRLSRRRVMVAIHGFLLNIAV